MLNAQLKDHEYTSVKRRVIIRVFELNPQDIQEI